MKFKFYNKFQDFAETEFDRTRIFRGHTNADWDLKSTYQRCFSNKPFFEWHPFGFKKILHSALISNYVNVKDFMQLAELNNLDLLIYLQHYGFPTPLLDFTKDSLIALYFAGSGVHYPNLRSTLEFGEKYDDLVLKIYNRRKLTPVELEHVFNSYPTLFIDVIELNVAIIHDAIVNVDQSLDFNQQLSDITSFQTDSQKSIVFSILNPQNNSLNYNLEQQKGAFIFIDSILSLEEFFQNLVDINKLIENPITHHLIPKPSLNYPDASIHDIETIYDYLSRKQITGRILFNDLQGLKFDMNLISGR